MYGFSVTRLFFWSFYDWKFNVMMASLHSRPSNVIGLGLINDRNLSTTCTFTTYNVLINIETNH